MFKKTLLVGAIALAATGAAMADGFYVGAGVGGTGFHDKASVTSYGSVDYGNLGVIGGVFAGYGWNFPNQFNLGLEAFGNATSAKVTDANSDTTAGSLTIKDRYNYGLRVLPGYQATPDTNVYGIVGYVRGNFKYSDNVGTSTTFNANGFQLGVGSATNVAKNVAVRGDVIYSGFQSKNVNDTSGGQTLTVKNQVNTLDGIVSISYKFG